MKASLFRIERAQLVDLFVRRLECDENYEAANAVRNGMDELAAARTSAPQSALEVTEQDLADLAAVVGLVARAGVGESSPS